MPIHLRKRGDIWHARGTIRIGRETITIPQFSTGCDRRSDAENIVIREEARIRASHQAGPADRQRSATIDEAFLAYLTRPGGIQPYDQQRIRDLSDRIGDHPLADAAAAWVTWLNMRGPSLAPGSVARFRATYCAAIAHGCTALQAGEPPEIAPYRHKPVERIVTLTNDERERLLAAYSPHAGRVATMLAFQGMRTQEALRLEWRDISLARGDITIRRSKTGKGRTLAMHKRVRAMLEALHAVGHTEVGAVFISARGTPYADTRGVGGNPLRAAHATACRKAGIKNFRVHDWRHAWAASMVMSGADLFTIMRLGGWTSLRMVERYASVTADHMREAVERMA